MKLFNKGEQYNNFPVSIIYNNHLAFRWYAGSSVEFETNKGRIMTFNPYLKTGLKDHEVTMKAKDGMEIVMLNIK